MGSELDGLSTELQNKNTINIDVLPIEQCVEIILTEDEAAFRAVRSQSKRIAAGAALMAAVLRNGHRVIYMGTGTSGRLGILDAVELLPTFGVGSHKVKGIIAGGTQAVFRAVENAEDDWTQGMNDLAAEGPQQEDLLVGISASGRTPYVLGAMTEARRIGMEVISIACNKNSPMESLADVAISPVVGPECITGSTRMKAGTAQKMVLNAMSTAAMVQLGKVYGNYMVDMSASNSKLRQRAQRMVRAITGADQAAAQAILDSCGGSVKLAILCLLSGATVTEAEAALQCQKGHVRRALASLMNDE